MNRTSETHAATLDLLERRFGARVAAGLSERAETLPHDVSERLRFGRDRALAQLRLARAQRTAPAVSVVGLGRSGAFALGGRVWLQLASWAPLAALVAGLVLIQQWTDLEQVEAAAEIDTLLLADDLPPAAYADPGFREFLKAPIP